MVAWKRTLDVAAEWKKASDKEMTYATLAGIVANKLKALAPLGGYSDIMRRELAEEFELMSTDSELDADTFDEAWSNLYDWADYDKTCWVKIV